MNEIIIAALSSGVIVSIIDNIFASLKYKNNQNKGIISGTRVLLYDRIKYLSKVCITSGEISREDLEDIIEMHRIYHDELSGNGFLDEIMQKVKSLKLKDED